MGRALDDTRGDEITDEVEGTSSTARDEGCEEEVDQPIEVGVDQSQRQQDAATRTCDTIPEGDAEGSDQLLQQMTGSGQDQTNLPAIPEEKA